MLLKKNKKHGFLPTAMGSIVLTLGLFSSVNAQDGEAIFKQNCAACHTTTESKLVGPGLKGVSERRSEAWILKFVKDPQGVANGGDADAKALIDKFGMPMPGQKISDDEIKAVISYIKSKDENAGKGAEVAEAPLREATEVDIVAGKFLFEGSTPFVNGGPSCISCHNVQYPDLISGGLLAKDLTDCYARLGGEAGLSGILSSPPFPAMTEAFKNKQITNDEAFALIAFLKNAGPKSRYVKKDLSDPLLEGGLLTFVIIIAAILIIWQRRKKNTVKKDIYDRQTEAIN